MKIDNFLNKILVGDNVNLLKQIPEESVDLIFADPPYNLQLSEELKRPDHSIVSGVKADWDQFSSFKEYDEYTYKWLKLCRNILKSNGSIWIIGSYHNIFRIGYILQNLGFWILNDIIWRKTNPMPNFRGKRFTNAHETMIWASKSEKSRYTFNYEAMKSLNGDLQMRSDWIIPICTGNERLKKDDGSKIHPTQKPENLLNRVIMSSTKFDDVILDPFFGTGTTGVLAKRLNRKFIGIEKNKDYVKAALERIKNTKILNPNDIHTAPKTQEKRIPFGSLLENGLINPGQLLTDLRNRWTAKVRADGSVISKDTKGSIHSVAAALQGLPACNGWSFWYIKKSGKLISIDQLRTMMRLTA